ncbi:MAG: 8-amino-7-oxononanoate synthase [Lentisphaeria bacterium]
MHTESWIEAELAALRRDGLLREPRTWGEAGGWTTDADGHRVMNLASNDYLDLARHPRVVAAAREALETYGAGAASSRLVSGTLELHTRLEARLAAHKGYPAALVTASGYAANAGVIPALLPERTDALFADRLAHASLLDGARQSHAALHRFRHNDPEHLRELLARHGAGPGRRLVVTESVFSMDGNLAPLAEIAAVTTAAGAMLLVDEAHATGIFGPAGGGRVRELGLTGAVNLGMGTLSKGLGSLGGVLACSAPMREWLVNRHRGFIYSTALPPAAAGAALGALDVLEAEPDRGARLRRQAAAFRDRLRAAGFDTGASASPIIPVMVGDPQRTVALARRLLAEHHILAAAIRPPTVPAGTSRLRLSVTLAHTPDALDQAATALTTAARQEGVL